MVKAEVDHQEEHFGRVLFTFLHDGQTMQVRKLVTIPKTEGMHEEFADLSVLNAQGQRVALLDTSWNYGANEQLESITANNIYSNDTEMSTIRDLVSRFNQGDDQSRFPVVKGSPSHAVVSLVDTFQVPLLSAASLTRRGFNQFAVTIPTWYSSTVTTRYDDAARRFVVSPIPH